MALFLRGGAANGHRAKQQKPKRLCPKGSQWLFLGVLLGIYLDRTFNLIVDNRQNPTPSSRYSSSLQNHETTFTPVPSQKSILSKRIITVFGAESSGSTFLATTLGIASGAFPPNGTVVTLKSDRFNNPGRTIVERVVARSARSPDGTTEIQHLSLPWGYWGSKKRNCLLSSETITVGAFVPEPCFRFDYESTWSHRLEEKAPSGCIEEAHISEANNNAISSWTCGSNQCGQNANNGYAIYPRRFYVNITSHLEWYLQRGVDITAVLSVRDKSASRAGKMRSHCTDETISAREEEKAMFIMSESLRRYGGDGLNGDGKSRDDANRGRVMLVSYETLMSLQGSYLFDIYRTLGINSTFVPEFKDGNEKYFKAT